MVINLLTPTWQKIVDQCTSCLESSFVDHLIQHHTDLPTLNHARPHQRLYLHQWKPCTLARSTDSATDSVSNNEPHVGEVSFVNPLCNLFWAPSSIFWTFSTFFPNIFVIVILLYELGSDTGFPCLFLNWSNECFFKHFGNFAVVHYVIHWTSNYF